MKQASVRTKEIYLGEFKTDFKIRFVKTGKNWNCASGSPS